MATLNRRHFLKGTAVATGFPTIIPAVALGTKGRVGPNDKIVMGCIGVGGMGTQDMGAFASSEDAHVIAVCDVKKDRRDNAKKLLDERYGNTDCVTYADFRELLARNDIDAVLIASNDHWHVLHALAAVRAGKDLYVEKPLGMSIEEVQTLRKAVRKHKRIFQFGTQQRSDRTFRVACVLVRNGRIGNVHTIEVGVHAGDTERSGLTSYRPEPIPEGLDYDFWLGPAPVAPFHPLRVINPHWFHIRDYSLGYVSGWGIHHMDIAQWGNDTELTGPVEVEGSAVYPGNDALCDNPVSWDTTMTYANGVALRFTGSGNGFEGVRHGITFRGKDGWVWVNRGALETHPENLKDEIIGESEIHLYESERHQQNLLDCIRSRKDPIANIDIAACSDIACQLAWMAFHTGRKLKWDPGKEQFPGDAAANRMLTRAMRSPWTL